MLHANATAKKERFPASTKHRTTMMKKIPPITVRGQKERVVEIEKKKKKKKKKANKHSSKYGHNDNYRYNEQERW